MKFANYVICVPVLRIIKYVHEVSKFAQNLRIMFSSKIDY